MKYVHNLRLYRYGLYGVLYGKWGTIRTRPSHPLAVRLPRTASTRKESCTAASSGCMALKRVASEPDTRMKTVPPTAVAETSARRSTVFMLYVSGANLSDIRR